MPNCSDLPNWAMILIGEPAPEEHEGVDPLRSEDATKVASPNATDVLPTHVPHIFASSEIR